VIVRDQMPPDENGIVERGAHFATNRHRRSTLRSARKR